MNGIVLLLALVLFDIVSLWVIAASENIGLVGPAHNITLLSVNLAAQKQLANREYAKAHKPFFVGSAHWEWCLLAEADQVFHIAIPFAVVSFCRAARSSNIRSNSHSFVTIKTYIT